MWGWLAFLVGIAYGYMKPGRQDKTDILKTGIIVGIVVALVFALLGWAFRYDPLGFGTTGIVGTIVSFVVLTVVFIIGVFIGDWLESARSPGMRRTV